MSSSSPGPELSLELRVVWPIAALDVIVNEPMRKTAVVLVADRVGDFVQFFLVPGLVNRLVRCGVELFALAGHETEQAHDALDTALEEAGAENVVTTWHEEDAEDLASLVVASSRASGLGRLLAVVDESSELGRRLKECLTAALSSD